LKCEYEISKLLISLRLKSQDNLKSKNAIRDFYSNFDKMYHLFPLIKLVIKSYRIV